VKSVQLGELAEFVNGVAFRPEDWHDSGLPIIRIQNLTDPTKPINRTTRQVDDKYKVRRGDLLVSWSATLGAFTWERSDEALVNQHIFRVVPNTSVVDSRYLRNILQGALVSMERHLHGATMKHVNRGEFLATEVPLPPLEEQRRIAAILDQADTLRTKRRHAIDQFDRLEKAMFIDVFGDPIKNGMNWPAGLLGDHVERVTDGEHKTPIRSESGIPLLSARSIQRGWIDFGATDFVPNDEYEKLRRRIEPQVGDVLISCSGTIGRVAQVREPRKFAMVRSVALARVGPTLSSGFLEHLLASDSMNALMNNRANSSAQANLFQNQIRNLPVVLPPVTLQKSFESDTEAVTRQRVLAIAGLAVLDELFASLQSRAFSGQL
jgi:type I restriction enzyme S subunit